MINSISGTAAVSGANSMQRSPASGPMEAVADFASHLANAVQTGERAALAGVNGTMPLNQVVQQVLEAERSVTTMISVRDKVVSGLLELTRMQV